MYINIRVPYICAGTYSSRIRPPEVCNIPNAIPIIALPKIMHQRLSIRYKSIPRMEKAEISIMTGRRPLAKIYPVANPARAANGKFA